IFSAEAELIELVAAKADALLPDVLSRHLATGDASGVREILETMLTAEEAKSALLAYFENFMAADAFLEFRDLETYATTAENLQLYLYVGMLRYSNLLFPLFYVPLEVTRLGEGAGFSTALINHLYANKRAIDFVLQELSERQKREWLSPIQERIN